MEGEEQDCQMEGEQQDKYQQFRRWFKTNGGLECDIELTRFGKSGYMGVSAREEMSRNKIILAVPRKLIIGLSTVRESALGAILKQYEILHDMEDDDTEFNILTLFLIFEKMKGPHSFYYPYLRCVDQPETIIHWHDSEILALNDPIINLNFIRQIRQQFQPTFATFQTIVNQYSNLFPYALDRPLFDYCYALVMTRCFGWGLPETMIVPYADFFNHSSSGVHHYVYNSILEQANHQTYIKKQKELDLAIFNIDNHKALPIAYEKDQRHRFFDQNQHILQKYKIHLTQQNVALLPNNELTNALNVIRREIISCKFDENVYLSSDSEDNDSNSSEEEAFQYDERLLNPVEVNYLQNKKYFQAVFKFVEKAKQPKFQEPKPEVNREFEDGVTFPWWNTMDESYFIVATAANIEKGEQIFNSYGRRSNRFLLIWYGFTYENNKYDSVPFRMWSQYVEKRTGKRIITRYLTELDWLNKIPIGNQRYPFTLLSKEFRLKKQEINLFLLAFLRQRAIVNHPILKQQFLLNKLDLSKVIDLESQKQTLLDYILIIKQVANDYSISEERFTEEGLKIRSYRKYFGQILIESNTSIIYMHLRGAQMCYQLIKYLISEKNRCKQHIYEYYKRFNAQEDNIQEMYLFRIFVREYFKLVTSKL